MANLRNIKSVQSAEVEIKDEAGTPMGVFFELAGPTHPKRKAIVFASARKAQERFAKTGRLELDDPAEQDLDGRANLASMTLGWRGYTDDVGAAVAFSHQAAQALYDDDTMAWLVDQLQAALNDKSRFTTRCAKG